MLSLHRVQPYRQQWQDHFGQKRYVPQRAGMQEAESQTRALFRWWERTGKQHRLKEPDKSKYEIYNAVKNEIGKSKNWRQLQERLAEKGITIRFKYKGQTSEIQGISFSKGEYTFKGSEIDRNFSFSKLDKCFGDVGQTTAGSNKQTVTAPVQKSVSAPDKTDNSFIAGLGGLFSGLSAPADEMPDDSFLRKKKKKKKKQLKL